MPFLSSFFFSPFPLCIQLSKMLFSPKCTVSCFTLSFYFNLIFTIGSILHNLLILELIFTRCFQLNLSAHFIASRSFFHSFLSFFYCLFFLHLFLHPCSDLITCPNLSTLVLSFFTSFSFALPLCSFLYSVTAY